MKASSKRARGKGGSRRMALHVSGAHQSLFPCRLLGGQAEGKLLLGYRGLISKRQLLAFCNTPRRAA